MQDVNSSFDYSSLTSGGGGGGGHTATSSAATHGNLSFGGAVGDWIPLAIVGGVVGLFGLFGLVLLLRSK